MGATETTGYKKTFGYYMTMLIVVAAGIFGVVVVLPVFVMYLYCIGYILFFAAIGAIILGLVFLLYLGTAGLF